jgi:hypothetical protein
MVGSVLAVADTHYVSLNGGDSSPYTNGWASASTNIIAAIAASTALDTVILSNGTYNLTNEIIIAANITVRSFTEGGHGTNDTIVDGGYPARSNRCFVLNANVGTVDGFSIRNGYNTNLPHHNGGGGVHLTGASFLKNCFIYNNIATQGQWTCSAAVNCRDGWSGIISNCTISGNTGNTRGGGIFSYGAIAGRIVDCRISANTCFEAGAGIWSGSGMTVSNCTVNANTSTWHGGGIYLGGSGLITDCIISNNNATLGQGGGVWLTIGTLRNSIITRNTAGGSDGGGVYITTGPSVVSLVSNCTVTANTGQNGGGGIFLSGLLGTGVIANCTISGNRVGSYGGGIVVNADGSDSQLVKNCLIYGNTNWLITGGGGVYLNWTGLYPYGLINCTIVSNSSGANGGGLYATTYSNYIANCIIYGNVTTNAGDNSDEVYNATAGGTNNFWYNCTPTNLVAGQGNTTNNPLFVSSGNYHLSSGSPCIDTGTNMTWMVGAFDYEGNPRIWSPSATVDMGAYEFMYSPVLVFCGTATSNLLTIGGNQQ